MDRHNAMKVAEELGKRPEQSQPSRCLKRIVKKTKALWN
jgi:hypothetical protein